MVDWIVALKEAKAQYGSSTSSLNKGDGLQRSTSSTAISMESSKSNASSTSNQRTASAITLNRGSIETPLAVCLRCQNHLTLSESSQTRKS